MPESAAEHTPLAGLPETSLNDAQEHSRNALLAFGLAAGPFYIVVGLVQMLLREGFNPARHPLSLLSLGPAGWVQIGNFIITGLMLVLFAVGIKQTLRNGRGRFWGPMLIGFYGAALIASGLFVADPMEGFPPGTPAGPPEEATLSGILHFMAGGLGFIALVAAMIIFALRLASEGKRNLAIYSSTTGALFVAGFGAIAASGGAAWGNIAFTMAVVLSWMWLCTLAAHLMTQGSRGRLQA